MKAQISRTQGWLTAGAVVLLQISTALGAEPAEAVTPPPTAEPAPAQSAAKVPYGVDDVLKLNKAKISENIILTYVQTSGTTYSLAPNDIMYLKEQGVPDSVVTAMMDTQRRASQVVAAQAAQSLVQNAQPVQAAPNPAPSTPLYAPAPATTYAQPADTTTTSYVQPASSVYVMSYPQASYAYSGGYSYWPSFYWGSSYCYPSYSGCYNYGYRGCYNYGYHGNAYYNGFYNGYRGGYNRGYHNNGNNGSHGGGFYNGAHTASAGSVSHGSSGSHSAPRAMRTAGHR